MKRIREKKRQKRTDTRKLAELNVTAYNTNLRKIVPYMEVDILLANTHPNDRKDIAKRFKDNGELSHELQIEYGLENY